MRPPARVVYTILLAALLAVALLATTIGAAGIPLPRLAAALGLKIASADPSLLARDELVLGESNLAQAEDSVIASEASNNAREGGTLIGFVWPAQNPELMQQLAEIEGISGIHLMAYKQEEWIGEIVTRSGVLSGREPWAPTHLDHLKQPASA